MIWKTAQAGNRASKTGRCLQWWDSVAERIAVASVQQKVHNYHPSFPCACVCVYLYVSDKTERIMEDCGMGRGVMLTDSQVEEVAHSQSLQF